MTTEVFRDSGRYHVSFTIMGVTRGFNLVEGEDGSLRYTPGYVEEISQQQSSGGLTYEMQPTTISSIAAFESWGEGAGQVLAAAGTSRPAGYSHSRGVDVSWGMAILSPARQSLTGETTTITKVVRTAAGNFALAGRYLLKLVADEWVQKYDATTGPFTDLVEYGNGTSSFLVAALGDSQDMVYSTDSGENWSVSTGNAATFLTVRGTSTVVPVLFSCTTAGLLKSSVNVTAFSNADRVGQTSETVTGVLTANNKIWVFKREGIYVYDGTTSSSFLPAGPLARTGNGKNPHLWIDGKMYAPYGGRMIQVDPFANTFGTVYLTQHPELNGSIDGIGGDTAFLYFALTNSAGETYLMKGNPSVGVWHTVAYLGANTPNWVTVLAPGTPHATNPVVAFGYGSTASRYFILPRDGLRPQDDSAYRYDIAGGVLYSSIIDIGALAFPKYLNSGRLTGDSLTAARSAIASYAADGDSSFTTVLTAVEDGLSRANLATPVSLSRVQSSLTLATGDDAHSPRVYGYAFDTTPAVPRRQQWGMGLNIEDREPPPNGGDAGKASFRELYDFLNTALRQGLQVTYTDYHGATFVAKIRDMQAASGMTVKPDGLGRSSVKQEFNLVVAEIQPSGTSIGTFVWGSSGWGLGEVYG